MNRDQFNRTGMFNTVAAYMEQNQSIWTGTKAVSDAVAELKAGIAAIDAKGGKQQSPTTGAADDKSHVREGFESKIFELSDQLSALAAVKKDANLAAQAALTRSGLAKLTDDQLEETGKRVAGLTTANMAALADYGVTAADVTALNALTTQFHSAKSAPRAAIAGRAGETATLPDLLTSTTAILRDRLDKLMTKFRTANAEFVAGYQSARVIVDRGGAQRPNQPSPTPPPAPPP
jgi:hypothetical protein